MKEVPFKIAGMGCYVPETIVSNNDIQHEYQIEPEAFPGQYNVEERRWVSDETPSWMGAKAALEAVEMAGLELEDIDLIVNASCTSSLERIMPEGGALIQRQLGLEDSGIPCFSLHANCPGFIQAIDMCASLLACNRYENILIVSAELFSKNLGKQYPDAVALVGDGAAAAVVTLPSAGETASILGIDMRTFGNHSDEISSAIGMEMIRGGSRERGDGLFKVDLPSYLEKSSPYLKELLKELRGVYGDSLTEIDLAVIHHPGDWIPGIIEGELGIPREKCSYINDKCGMFGSASIPVSLYEAISRRMIGRGDTILMIGAGAGISLAGAVLKY